MNKASSMMIGQETFQWLQEHQHPVHYFPSITSTNAVAKEAAISEKHARVFYIAESQTQGRGQGTHSWLNATPGTNLLLTCSLESKQVPQPELCLAFGHKIHKICLNLWPRLNWRVKAPNDLYLEDKKVAGLLLESVTQGPHHRLLFGFGFNVLEHPEDTSFMATHLQQHLQDPISIKDWHRFLEQLVELLATEI